MSKKVDVSQLDDAGNAVLHFRTCVSYKDAITSIQNKYKGRISGIKQIKLKKGVTEIVRIKFPDRTAVLLNKYIPNDGKINLSIRKEAQ